MALLFYATDSPVIATGGKMPDGRNTKVLWLTRQRQDAPVTLTGVLTDDSDVKISQELSGAYDFPSIVDLPAPGCWRLSLIGQKGSLGSIKVPAEVM
ncbi:MAG: hypothetical protein QOI54_809 [Actinomycetota bacterium]|nr:hypothetical protein [Actinomycetota bacterium]